MTDFNFANLPDTEESQVTETEIFNAIETYFTTKGRIRVPSRFVSTDLEQGDSQLVVEVGNAVDVGPDIQKALDTLNERGGGTVFLKAGTYTVKTALTGYSSVSIQGISPSATVIDFVSTAANLSYAGTLVYNTGTIASVAADHITVTGSGTSWLANVTAGQYLFLGTRHYKIAAVTADTTLILSEGYTDDVTGSYRIVDAIVDVKLSHFAVKSTTGTGIVFSDALQITLDNVQAILCNKGFSFTNVSRTNIDRVLNASSTSNGYEFTNVGLCDWESVNSSAAGGHGFVLNNVKTVSALLSCQASTSDGYNLTNVDQTILIVDASGNGGQGMELVSGCDDNTINGLFIGNTSDGLRIEETSDRNKITGIFKSNGNWGIAINASSDDNNVIDVPLFSGNTSGNLSDSGTGTQITSITDNIAYCLASQAHLLTSTTNDVRVGCPIVVFADGVAEASALFAVKIPNGVVSIKTIRVKYYSAGSGNLRLRFEGAVVNTDTAGSNATNDVTDAYTAYVGNTEITVPAAAYNGVTFDANDIFSLRIYRESNHADDTYNAVWDVFGVEFHFNY